MTTKQIVNSINGVYMNYKDIMVAFKLGTTKASQVKSDVAKEIQNQCPYSTELVKTQAVFSYMGIDLDDYIEHLTKIKKLEEI